jgi:hypothetical protein
LPAYEPLFAMRLKPSESVSHSKMQTAALSQPAPCIRHAIGRTGISTIVLNDRMVTGRLGVPELDEFQGEIEHEANKQCRSQDRARSAGQHEPSAALDCLSEFFNPNLKLLDLLHGRESDLNNELRVTLICLGTCFRTSPNHVRRFCLSTARRAQWAHRQRSHVAG